MRRLPETITNGIILKKLSHLELYKAIEQLIKDKKEPRTTKIIIK